MMEDKFDELIGEQKRHHNKIEAQNRLKNVLLFMILLAIIFHAVFCCPHPAVKGYELDKYVEDTDGNPLAGATVVLYNHPNGMVISQGETDENGWANFTNIRYGHYYLWVSYGGVTNGEWVWVTEDTQITNTLALPTEEE